MTDTNDQKLKPSGKDARDIIRRSLTASLATLEADAGAPAVSLIAVGTDIYANPLCLISNLALHTRNITADNRAAILFDGTSNHENPLEGGRVSVKGRLVRLDDDLVSARYLRRHEDAHTYVGFPDFHFYRLNVERAYFVGGFGKIYTIEANELILDEAQANKLASAEADIIEHMNSDHSDAIQNYARHAGAEDGESWSMTGIDPEGFDLRARGLGVRVPFDKPILSAQDARVALVELAKQAKG